MKFTGQIMKEQKQRSKKDGIEQRWRGRKIRKKEVLKENHLIIELTFVF